MLPDRPSDLLLCLPINRNKTGMRCRAPPDKTGMAFCRTPPDKTGMPFFVNKTGMQRSDSWQDRRYWGGEARREPESVGAQREGRQWQVNWAERSESAAKRHRDARGG